VSAEKAAPDAVVAATEFATSADGTRIAFERAGTGPVVVLVDGAMVYREFGGGRATIEALRDRYTAVIYDRRGRGESGNTLPYSPDREIEDLRAVIAAVGGDVVVLGQSSGAALAFRAAAAGVPMRAVIGYEAPYVGGSRKGGGDHFTAELDRRIADGKPGKAIDYFMTTMVGGPWFMPVMMRSMPKVWKQLLAVAPTLPNDSRVMAGFRVPRAEFGRITVPALVAVGGKAKPDMVAAEREIAEAIPGAQHVVLEGQTHMVDPVVLGGALDDFLRGVID
jgi:pimeloyl-ACP methyl ester carboxylesterase